MNCDVTIREECIGPTILEIEPVINEIPGVIEVRWEGTQAELAALRRNSKRFFHLIVPDMSTMERTAAATGKSLKLESSFVESAKMALNSRKGNNWRFMADDLGPGVARAVVVKLSADSIRRGKKPKLARITSEVLCEGLNSVDADILLRLSNLRGSRYP